MSAIRGRFVFRSENIQTGQGRKTLPNMGMSGYDSEDDDYDLLALQLLEWEAEEEALNDEEEEWTTLGRGGISYLLLEGDEQRAKSPNRRGRR